MAKNNNYLIIKGTTHQSEERTLYSGKEIPLEKAHKVLGDAAQYGTHRRYHAITVSRSEDIVTFCQEEVSHFDPDKKFKATFCHRTDPKRINLPLDEKTKKIFDRIFKL